MKKIMMFLSKNALALAAVVAVADASLRCVGPFGQPEVPTSLMKK